MNIKDLLQPQPYHHHAHGLVMKSIQFRHAHTIEPAMSTSAPCYRDDLDYGLLVKVREKSEKVIWFWFCTFLKN